MEETEKINYLFVAMDTWFCVEWGMGHCDGSFYAMSQYPKNHLWVSFWWASSSCVFYLLDISSPQFSMITTADW